MNKDSWYKAVKRRVTWPLAKTGATAKGGGSGSLATEAKPTKEYFLSGIELTKPALSISMSRCNSMAKILFQCNEDMHVLDLSFVGFPAGLT
jgi:hypothetical protein